MRLSKDEQKQLDLIHCMLPLDPLERMNRLREYVEKYYGEEHPECNRILGTEKVHITMDELDCENCEYWNKELEECGAFECNGNDCPELPCEK